MKKTKNILKLLILSWGIFLGLQTHACNVIEVCQKSIQPIYRYDVEQNFFNKKITFPQIDRESVDSSSQKVIPPETSHQLTWQAYASPHAYNDETVFVFLQNAGASKTARPRNAAGEMEEAVKSNQADRIVLNLEDSPIQLDAMKQQLDDYPIDGLKEVLAIKDGQIINLWP